MAEHATLSASSAERWINCPGSVHMASLFPSTSSAAAQEGTLAHALAAEILQKDESNGLHAKFMAEIETEIEAFYYDHPELKGSALIMEQTIEPYTDYVMSEYLAVKANDKAAELLIEQRVDFSHIVPGGFGTSDVVIVGDDMIEVIDLKYGKGVAVSAVNNPQIRLYALGAIALFDLIYDFSKVKMIIYQPRLDSVTEEIMDVKTLKEWAEAVVRPAAKTALSKNPPYSPGEWCSSHFCPGAGACKARAEYLLSLGQYSDRDPALLSLEEISNALTRAETLQKWVKQLNSYALSEAMDGRGIPGWKVVESRTNRAYTDTDKVAEAAIAAGFPEASIYDRKLLGITDMERLMGKKTFAKVLGGLVEKPKGVPKLAPETDARPPYDGDIIREFD